MKPRGQWLIGVDFDFESDGELGMFVVPMRRNMPMWSAAERLTREAFDRVIEEERHKRRELREAEEAKRRGK